MAVPGGEDRGEKILSVLEKKHNPSFNIQRWAALTPDSSIQGEICSSNEASLLFSEWLQRHG